MNFKPQLKSLFHGLTVLAFTLGVSVASSATLSLTPSQTSFSSSGGDTFSVSLNISGLGNHAPSSLGAYDILLGWSGSFKFLNASFGTGLGNTLFDTAENNFNNLQLIQVSEESVANLIANQPGEFTLATMSFRVIDNPSSGGSIGFSSYVLSDENGDELTTTDKSSIELLRRDTPTPSAIPLPATWLLFSVGFALVEGTRRWSEKRHQA